MIFQNNVINNSNHSISDRPKEKNTPKITTGKAIRARILAGGYTKGLSPWLLCLHFQPNTIIAVLSFRMLFVLRIRLSYSSLGVLACDFQVLYIELMYSWLMVRNLIINVHI